MPFIIPPGGFAGFNQMTPASRAAMGRVGNVGYNGNGKRRRKRAGTRADSTRRRARGKSSGGRRKSKMKFGSPAWQKKYKVGKFRKK